MEESEGRRRKEERWRNGEEDGERGRVEEGGGKRREGEEKTQRM